MSAGWNGSGCDIPDARPLYGAAFLGCELGALLLGFAVHLREHIGVQVALIERCLAAANYRCDDAGKGLDAAHGADCVRMLAGDGADFKGEFGGGGEGVAARVHRGGAGVRLLTVKSYRVALDALGAEYRGERKAHLFKYRALFDVQLEVGCGVLALDLGVADCVDRRFRNRTGHPQAACR